MIALYSWVLFGIVGVLMGIIAFIVDALVESMIHIKWEMTRNVIKDTGLGAAWMVFLLISVFYAALASSMTVYIGPGAAGSGIAELMGYLNGI